MAEVKNSFLSSKMNQDLDDRLIPNGEYRSALNVSIGKSESSDVGTLQNILGNERVVLGDDNVAGLECIGYYMDNVNNRIFQFLTNADYSNTSPAVHRITVYSLIDGSNIILVDGEFLNFSKEYPITGITLLENLLFWTDFNNQPRKINVQSALNAPATSTIPYYTNEDQISVAKYAPVDAISLYKKTVTTNTAAVTGNAVIPVASISGLEIGMTMLSSGYSSNDFIIVESVGVSSVTVSTTVTIPADEELTFLISTMTNKSEDPYWPGDPAYLNSRYVRFSYRFKLDDGEYTLMAPFTQITYIPNQKGYFINGNENDAYTSTVIKWFENNVNNIQLLVPFPDLISNVEQSYKVRSLDILYKEADSMEVKVLDTILSAQFAQNTLNNSNIYVYDYQSRKPYKTLPSDQITRVYDIVPVRAKAQESSSNRIIYGNFVSGHTAPHSLNYQVSINEKQDFSYNFIEYPNHTVKQNRTYQVGFILADKYGRQSSVILSSLDATTSTANGNIYGGSTVYAPYYSQASRPNIKNWFGDAISILLNSPITSNYVAATGEPGLYAQSTSTTGFTLIGTTTITDTTYDFEVSAGTPPNQYEFLRGQYTDYVQVLSITEVTPGVYNAITSGRVSDLYAKNSNDPDIKYVYTINPLGWYSYKVVVRQQEQDYYNVYLPGFLNGYPAGQTYGSQVVYSVPAGTPETKNGINTTVFPINEAGQVAHTVLINDNINKIPRDLVEVGPDQKLYRSSVQLFGRVQNTINTGVASNTQYYPSKKADTAITIGSSMELGFLPATVDNTLGSATYNFYQLETSPLIARISTTNTIGVIGIQNVNTSPNYPSAPGNMLPYLSIYETKPDYSLLDIYWETSTSGLISDLNADILTGYEGANGLTEINWGGFREDLDPGVGSATKWITNEFWPVSNTGNPINSSGATLQVRNGYGTISTSFDLDIIPYGVGPLYYKYRIRSNQFQTSRNDVNLNNYTFYLSFIQSGETVPTTISFPGQLENISPTIMDTSFNPLPSSVNVYLTSPLTTGTPVYSLLGKNGSAITGLFANTTDLSWKITGGSANWQNYFNITTEPTFKGGAINQIAPLANLQTVQLNVQLSDASTLTGIPSTGAGIYGTLTDNITVNIQLATTIICGRTWTSRNYDGTTYNDSVKTPIPQITNATDWANATAGAWCWPNFDENLGAIYGRLYNVYAIKGIWNASQPGNIKPFAPAGWRIPFYQEQCILSCTSSNHMKSLTPAYPATGSWLPNPNLGDNSTGFSALPAGYMNESGTWVSTGGNGQIAIYHMSPPTVYFLDNSPAYMAIYGDTSTADIGQGVPMRWGMSVRFVNDFSITKTVTNPFPTSFPPTATCAVLYNDTNYGNPHQDILHPGQTISITTCAECTIGGSCTIS